MIERAGIWRRGAAALVDMILVQVLLLVVVGTLFQMTGGRVTSGVSLYTACRPETSPPSGWTPPRDFEVTSASLCTSSLFGLTTRSVYVARHDGKSGTAPVSRVVGVSPDGSVARGALSFDALFWPLFVLVRWFMDRSAGGSPGRRLTRIAITDQGGTAAGRAMRALLARRYARFAWPYAPGVAMLALITTWEFVGGSIPQPTSLLTWLTMSALIGAAHLTAVMAIFRHRDAFYDEPSGAVVTRRIEIARARDMQPEACVFAVPTPWADLVSSAGRAWAGLPWISVTLIGVFVAFYIGELLLPWSPPGPSSVSVETMMAWGGMDRLLVVGSHQIYRLIASVFLHANSVHLLANGTALLVAGFLLERLLGGTLFLGIFVIGGLAGSVASIGFNPPQQISIGASGAVLALYAAMLGMSIALPEGNPRRWRFAWAITICVPTLLPGVPLPEALAIDRADHLGGELAGLLMGLAVAAAWRRVQRRPSRYVAHAALAVTPVLLLICVLAGGLRAPVQSSAMIPPSLFPPDAAAGVRNAAALATRYPEDPRALMFLAQADVLARRPGDAARDLDRALAAAERLDPMGAQAHAYAAHTVLGGRFVEIDDLPAAIAQYTSALAERTDDVVAFRQRGIAEFYSDQPEAALTDLDSAVRIKPIDPYAALWDHIVATRAWRSNRNSVLQAALDRGHWPAPVMSFFLGDIDADQLAAAAADPDPKTAAEHACEVDFYRGEKIAMLGNPSDAQPLMLKAVTECPKSFIEYNAAHDELDGRGRHPAR